MRKLLLSLAGTALAFAANATLYVVGAGDGLTWDLPGKAIEAKAEGVYEFTVTNLTKFKASLNNSTEWDGDGGYNAAAYGTGNTTFNNTVYPNGQTLPMEAWGEDQEVPWTGDYTITMDFNAMTMTAKTSTPQPTAAPNVYIRGGMNSWGSGAAWQFTNVSWDGNAGVYTWTGSISAGVEFKIADANWGGINYSTNGTITQFDTPINLNYNGQNSKFAQDFNGTITFSITSNSDHQATATFSLSGSGPVYPDNLYIIGTINGNAWDPSNVAPMTNEGDGIYTIDSVTLLDYSGTTGFAITAGGSSWEEVNALRFGPTVQDSQAIIGENTDISTGDLSWSIVPGTYSMTFDYNDRVLVIESKSNVPPTEHETTTVYVVGAGEGLTWDLPGKAYAGQDGVVSFTVNGLSKFKVSKSDASEWDSYNAEAYATGLTTFDASVGVAPGQTLPIEVWGEDQMLPFEGDYTITVDFNKMTMTAYCPNGMPLEAPTLYIRGGMNDWGTVDAWKFDATEWDAATVSGKFTWTGAISAGVEFKFADANWGTYNYGGEQGIVPNSTVTLAFNADNMTMASNFEGTITLTFANGDATAYFAMEGEAKDPENFYVIGTIAQGIWQANAGVKMEGNGEGIYTADEVTLVESSGTTGFAITANLGATPDDWSTVNALRFGPAVQDSMAVVGVNSDLATGDLSWTFNPGSYKMVFDYRNRTLTISKATNVINVIEAAEGEAIYFDLQGRRITNPERGIYILIQDGKTMKVVK